MHRSINQLRSCYTNFRTAPKLSPDGSALVYSTFLGGLEAESGNGIAVDSGGNAYVMGQTDSANFPTLNGVQPTWGGGCNYGQVYYPCFDVFVTKVSPDGSSLVYSTYLGGNRDEAYFFGQAGDIAIDPAGYAYVTGYTESLNFPTANALQPSFAGGFTDAYVTKLSPDGSSFVYSTFLGGSFGEYGFGIAADQAGIAYIAGLTGSPDFPTTPDAFQPTKHGNTDAFVSKLTSDGSAFVYSTFLGGTNENGAASIATDSRGNAYVTGSTSSTDFPIMNAFQPTIGGLSDGFVTKITPDGKQFKYSSYLGGSLEDGGIGIAVDESGSAYVTGATRSTDFPTVNALQSQSGGGWDAFITKIRRSPADPLAP
jgi:hypothetical protein